MFPKFRGILATRLSPTVYLPSPAAPSLISRQYHDEAVYGYRVPKVFKKEDYTEEELKNRTENGSLLRFVQAYRTYGHSAAALDPLGLMDRSKVLALDPARYGLNDMDKSYNLSGVLFVKSKQEPTESMEVATFGRIYEHLRQVYCGRIAYEFMHIPSASERRWWYEAVEMWNRPQLNSEEKKRIYRLLVRSEVFDHFMAKKFGQVKRYGLEGAESMMCALDSLFKVASHDGIKDLVLCMPHRGRLNFLTDLLQYPPKALFHKVKGNAEFPEGILHGDAAFTGQGVVMETFGMSNLPHYTSGGSVHIVVNNQIGYTTPAQNARSSAYASDIGKMVNAPVLHVNGDYPEDVVRAMSLAYSYRAQFKKDIVLDLITYRRMGHNELDEPAFTQPLMYNNIRSRKSVPTLYEEQLISEGVLVDPAEADSFRGDYYAYLEDHFNEAASFVPEADHLQQKWSGMIQATDYARDEPNPPTGVDRQVLMSIGKASVTSPIPLQPHPRIEKYHIQQRLSKIAEGKKIDWATAEAFAWGSLLLDGYDVRISGQDVGRGTFSQRHAMLVDQETENVVIPLNHMKDDQPGKLEVANSNLSEFAVLGFEYGMSWETPKSLNIWEAQFGDFFNSAQVIIDTYVASGEGKYKRFSISIERFLQLCDDRLDILANTAPVNPNMHVVNLTTPAQYFHALRRQMLRKFRKPLIVAAPKTLLKLSAAVSDMSEMDVGTSFKPILTEDLQDRSTVKKVVFVSGKLYYDLVKERLSRKLEGEVLIVRLEELCPFPAQQLKDVLRDYSHAQKFIWCQEEPQNGGAYQFVAPRLSQLLPSNAKLNYVGRPPMPAPATGIGSRHKAEQARVLEQAFKI
ncbi:hypothetical protein BZG36_04628 [Bifiguratus adelaidae]|uniref:Transketolase-like pyrimidine-binding domain-containing protein n=1 Tax=Bifiguratus adelaidae TaxID=1938954 RepID=A0A261XV94_9FUNG|nr:hypothetical protein BZG36_04628 [Bifiguratus adelaidae]